MYDTPSAQAKKSMDERTMTYLERKSVREGVNSWPVSIIVHAFALRGYKADLTYTTLERLAALGRLTLIPARRGYTVALPRGTA